MTLTAPEFDWVCDLVRRESAIVLEEGKEYLAETRLHPIARSQGLASVSELVQGIQSGKLRSLEADVVDAMTTNETSFFRDVHPWDSLRTEIVPEIIERRRATRTIDVWCAACSSGQEPYSLALLLKEQFAAELDGWRVRIIATDLSGTMLERCRAGRYSQLEVNRGLPAPMLLRWFKRDGMEFELDPEIRSMVEVRALNLDDRSSWAGLPQLDLVFIRNVLIYFDVATKSRILEGVRGQMRPDAPMLLGSSETTIGLVDCFGKAQSGRTIYYTAR